MSERQVDLACAEQIASGADSFVYLGPAGTVLKQYFVCKSPEPILRYQGLTNRASLWLQRNPREGKMSINDETWDFETQIVPIQDVVVTDNGPVGVSEYIPGPKLNTIIGYVAPVLGEFGGITDQERNFLISLEEVFKNRDVCDQFYNYFASLSHDLDRAMGVKGIFISNVNVKVRADVDKRKIRFIITDISDYIADLRFYKESLALAKR